MASYNEEHVTKVKNLKVLTEELAQNLASKKALEELTGTVEGITPGDKNVIEKIKVNTVEQQVASEDKSVNIEVPTKVSKLENDSGFQTESEVNAKIKAQIGSAYKAAGSVTQDAIPTPSEENAGNVYNVSEEFTADTRFIEGEQSKTYPAGTNIVVVQVDGEYKFDILSGFVDTSNFVTKEPGKGLSTKDFTAEDKSKLDTLQNYEHPASESGGNKTADLYKISTDAEGHVKTAEKVTKQDITELGIPDENTTYEQATQSSDGLMSSIDKKKLDEIEYATDEEIQAMCKEVFGSLLAS